MLVAVAIATAVTAAACGDEGTAEGEAIEHVHGLGINPEDGALFIATHSGLFRSPEGEGGAERVGEGNQDTMGFTILDPDHFLGSGHPGPGQGGPPNLGLIESTDGGESWRQVSLAGDADFHVLRHALDRVYAFNGLSGELMLSDDGGRSWTERRPPAPLIDLAVDPRDPGRILASSERGLAVSKDDGRRWRPISGDIGLLAWPTPDRIVLINARGEVKTSKGVGTKWSHVGNIGAPPAAFTALDGRELYAALTDGTVLRSSDAGASWDVRVRS